MENRIRDILGMFGCLPVPLEQVVSDDDLYEAGLSSLATVNVMLAIEDALDLEFPDQLLTRCSFQSIASLTGVVMALKSSATVL